LKIGYLFSIVSVDNSKRIIFSTWYFRLNEDKKPLYIHIARGLHELHCVTYGRVAVVLIDD